MHTRVSRLAARLAPRVGGHAWQEVLLDSGGVAGGVGGVDKGRSVKPRPDWDPLPFAVPY